MSAKNPYLEELGQFLKARRSERNPADLGLHPGDPGTRRVSGLRREEVAAAVAISHDYYTRIEQGRLAPSEPVLDAIAGVLRLTATERTYAEGLARQADRRGPAPRRSTRTRPQLQRLLDQLSETPAFIVGKYLDLLAFNAMAGALLADVGRIPAAERNFVRMIFMDPQMKALYEDWEGMARASVSLLRMQALDNPNDPRLAALVGELSLSQPLFRKWWAARTVAREEFGTKTVRHPELGDLTIDWDGFMWAGDPDQQLVVWSARPGSPTEDKLRILSSWIATPAASPSGHRPSSPPSPS